MAEVEGKLVFVAVIILVLGFLSTRLTGFSTTQFSYDRTGNIRSLGSSDLGNLEGYRAADVYNAKYDLNGNGKLDDEDERLLIEEITKGFGGRLPSGTCVIGSTRCTPKTGSIYEENGITMCEKDELGIPRWNLVKLCDAGEVCKNVRGGDGVRSLVRRSEDLTVERFTDTSAECVQRFFG